MAVTPYFVPDDDLLQAMRFAVLRGVELTLVVPRRSNHRIADFVRGRALRLLADAGARVRLVPRMLHAKAVVVDESLAWSGSVNLDARSLLINYESIGVFYGEAEIRWLIETARYPPAGDDRWMMPVVDRVYGTHWWDGTPVRPGKSLGWTDWTHPRR